MLDHTEAIADGGATVFALAALPFGSVGRQTVLTALVLLFAAAIVVRALLPEDDDSRSILDHWLLMAGGGLLITIAGWVLYVPADPYYNPSSPGAGNRVNAMAAIGLVIIVYAAVVVTATLLFRGVPRGNGALAATCVALAILLAAGYAGRTRDDGQAWARASTAADEVLAATVAAVPDPAPGSTIYTFGHPGSERPGIVVFGFTWDLLGAIRLAYSSPAIAAYPILDGTTIKCLHGRLNPLGAGWIPDQHGSVYGKAYFVDVPSGTAERIDSAQACRAASTRFHPGPVTRIP
jgi:protein-S-isoprenylcysteine O-methyltransferase Ste14